MQRHCLSMVLAYLSVGIWDVLSGLVFQDSDFLFEDMMQVTIKCDKRVVVFDGVSKDVECSALLSMLEVWLGVKIPGNALLLIGNRRFIGLGESIAEVIQILYQYLLQPVIKPFYYLFHACGFRQV